MLSGEGAEEEKPSPPQRPLILKILVIVLFAYGVWEILGVIANPIAGYVPEYAYLQVIAQGIFWIIISYGLWLGNWLARVVAILASLGWVLLAIIGITQHPTASLFLLIVYPALIVVLLWPSVSAFFSKKGLPNETPTIHKENN